MQRCNLMSVLLLLAFVESSATAQGLPIPIDWKAKFMAEAPAGWKRYFAFAKHLQGTATRSEYDVAKGRVEVRHTTVTLRQGKNCALLFGEVVESKSKDKAKKKQAFANGFNSRYWFELDGSSTSAWRIKELSPTLSEPPTGSNQAAETSNDIATWICSNLQLYDVWLSDVVSDPGFSITSIAPDSAPGKSQLIKLDFTYTPPESRRTQIRGGVFDVNPTKDWILTGYRLNCQAEYRLKSQLIKTEGTIQCSLEYAAESTELPIVNRSVLRSDATKRTDGRELGHVEVVVERNLHSKENIPEEECSVSVFGFPEPFTTERVSRNTGWWYWVGGSVFLFTVAGLLFRYSRRKPRSSPSGMGVGQ